MTCTFFGHKDCPSYIYDRVYAAIEELIEHSEVDCFLVGEEGGFDRTVQRALFEIKKKYPQIVCLAVKAYYDPKKKDDPGLLESIYPECLSGVPKRFAIDRRNRYMIERSEVVITYVRTSIGGAAKFVEIAVRKKKRVINIATDDYSS